MMVAPVHVTRRDLEELLTTSSARASVLIQTGQSVIFVGDLSDAGFQKIQSAMQRYWMDADWSNQMKYAGLSINGDFYFLFAQLLKENTFIGFVFPLKVPLVRIRKEMTHIMRFLLDPDRKPTPAPKRPHQTEAVEKSERRQQKKTIEESASPESEDEDPLEQTLQFLFKSFPEPDPEEIEDGEDQGWQPERDTISAKEDRSVVENPVRAFDEKEDHLDHTDQNDTSGLASFAPHEEDPFQELPLGTDLLISEADAPKEAPQTPDAMEQIDDVPLTPHHVGDDFFSSDETGPIRISLPDESENDWQPLNDIPIRDDDLASILQDDFELDDALTDFSGLDDDVFEPEEMEEDQQSKESEDAPDTLLAEILAGEMEDAQAMDAISDVTFYLVPRLAHHYLLGELSHRLRRWVPKICQAFGWRLDFLSVRPDYLKWTFSDFPEVGIKEMLQIMRRQTSDRIFRDFPSLQVENQSGDYWSPSYLVDKENRYFSTQALMSFVSKTRYEDSSD